MSFLPRFNEAYARDKSRRERAGVVRVLAVVGVLAVIAFISRDTLAPFVRDAAAPLMQGASALDAGNTLERVVVSKESLQAERDALLSRISDLEYRSLLADTLAEENAELRALLSAAGSEGGVSAKIIARPDRTAYDTLLVDRGSASGVSVGDIAVAGSAVAFGDVVEVGERTALIRLYSSPGHTADITLADGTTLIATGIGGGMFIAEAAHDVPVELGDTVSFSGSSAALAFARVADISSSPADPFKTLRFGNPVNFNTLRFVTLLKRVQ